MPLSVSLGPHEPPHNNHNNHNLNNHNHNNHNNLNNHNNHNNLIHLFPTIVETHAQNKARRETRQERVNESHSVAKRARISVSIQDSDPKDRDYVSLCQTSSVISSLQASKQLNSFTQDSSFTSGFRPRSNSEDFILHLVHEINESLKKTDNKVNNKPSDDEGEGPDSTVGSEGSEPPGEGKDMNSMDTLNVDLLNVDMLNTVVGLVDSVTGSNIGVIGSNMVNDDHTLPMDIYSVTSSIINAFKAKPKREQNAIMTTVYQKLQNPLQSKLRSKQEAMNSDTSPAAVVLVDDPEDYLSSLKRYQDYISPYLPQPIRDPKHSTEQRIIKLRKRVHQYVSEYKDGVEKHNDHFDMYPSENNHK